MGRCARKDGKLKDLVEPYLLKVVGKSEDFKIFSRVSALVAYYSESPLDSFQLFYTSSLGPEKKGMAPSFWDFLAQLLKQLASGLHLEVSGIGYERVALELFHHFWASESSALQELSFSGGEADSNFLRLLQVFISPESLYSQAKTLELNQIEEEKVVLLCLPLAKAEATYEDYWQEIERVLEEIPEGLSLLVLGRSELLLSPLGNLLRAGRDAHSYLLETGQLLALAELGPKNLLAESATSLSLALLRSQKVYSPDEIPVALFNLAGLSAQVQETEKVKLIHDFSVLLQEDLSLEMRAPGKDHELLAGRYRAPENFQDLGGILPAGAPQRKQPAQGQVQRFNELVRSLSSSELPDFQMNWVLEALPGKSSYRPAAELLEPKYGFTRVAGTRRSLISEDLVHQVEAENRAGWVRLLDEESWGSLRSHSMQTADFRGISVVSLGQVGEFVQLARAGDFVISESRADVFLVEPEDGLILVQAPLFLLRPVWGVEPQDFFGLKVLAGLLASGLGKTKKVRKGKGSFKAAELPQEVFDRLEYKDLGGDWDFLGRSLKDVDVYRSALLDRLYLLDALEEQTLTGLSDGNLRVVSIE